MKKFFAGCSFFLLFITIACSVDKPVVKLPVELAPEVNITTPIDTNGLLNRVEANSIIVKGTTSIEDKYMVTVILSDGQNSVAGTAVVNSGRWATQSLAISDFHNGEVKVTAKGTNKSGIMSSTAEASLYLDQVSPKIEIFSPVAEDDIVDSEEAIAVVIRGTTDAANGQKVLIILRDNTTNHLEIETKVNNGHWQVTANISSFKSGSLMIMAWITDIAGNPGIVQKSGVTIN
ncbi:MAG TPA: hypothetical protein VFM60_03350 [Salinimicrobium sp.]|nr:hypothetical protein [Salinimicrobium sp.]